MNAFIRSASALALGAACASLAVAQSPDIRANTIRRAIPIAAVPGRVSLPDSLVLRTAQSRRVAAADPSEEITAMVSLRPRDLAGLEALADAVSDPASPSYRRFITPKEVGDRFGASEADRRAVVDFLASKGLAVTLNAPSGLAIVAQGTARQWGNAFGTSLATFVGPDASGTQTIRYRANATPLSVPAGLSSVVECVSGLDTNDRPRRLDTTTTLTPLLISGAYNLGPSTRSGTAQAGGFYGAGRRIAISNWDGFRFSSASLYVQNYGLPTPAAGAGTNVTETVISGYQSGNAQYNYGEGDLDIQMVLSQAPLADVRIYTGVRNQTATSGGQANRLVVTTQEANDNWADVITESYGWSSTNATTVNSYHNVQLQMTVQGQTYMAASGDSSTHLSPYAYPDFDPEVLQVGGTIATVDTATALLQGETAWVYSAYSGNSSSTPGGTGGGWYNSPTAVTFNTLPSWQKGTGVPTNVNRRLIPDVAFPAGGDNKDIGYDPTSVGCVYVVYLYNGTQYLTQFDGTSASSPMLAGMLGTLEGRLYASNTDSTRPRLGRIQNLVYSQNGRSDVYRDTLVGTAPYGLPASSTGTANSYTGPIPSCTPGWDYLTGWGSMDMEAFYQSLLPAASIALSLGNFSGDATQIPVAVTFRYPGTTSAVSTQTVYPAANGTLVVKAPGVGTYDVSIKASHWLRRTLSGVAFASSGTTSLSAALVNGDANGDNGVTAADRSLVTAALGTSSGQAGYSASVDLNGDGFVTAADRSIVTTNLGKTGDN